MAVTIGLLEDCPICKLISDGKILQKGEHFCKVKMDDRVLVVGLEHCCCWNSRDYIEASTMLLEKAPPNGIVRELTEWPGHWAMELQVLTEGAGKSVVGS